MLRGAYKNILINLREKKKKKSIGYTINVLAEMLILQIKPSFLSQIYNN